MAGRMEQRRAAWEERGWSDYIHVDVTSAHPPAKPTDGERDPDKTRLRLPVRIWGEQGTEATEEDEK